MVLESISRIIKVQLPAYLKRLPLPETIGGFARLTGKLIYGGCATRFVCPEAMAFLHGTLLRLEFYLLNSCIYSAIIQSPQCCERGRVT